MNLLNVVVNVLKRYIDAIISKNYKETPILGTNGIIRRSYSKSLVICDLLEEGGVLLAEEAQALLDEKGTAAQEGGSVSGEQVLNEIRALFRKSDLDYKTFADFFEKVCEEHYNAARVNAIGEVLFLAEYEEVLLEILESLRFKDWSLFKNSIEEHIAALNDPHSLYCSLKLDLKHKALDEDALWAEVHKQCLDPIRGDLLCCSRELDTAKMLVETMED